MRTLSTGVFERSGAGTMTRRSFYFTIGAILAWGFVLTYIMASLTVAWQPSLLAILVVGLGIPILGIFIAIKSDNPLISFFGYHLIVVPFGALIGPTVATYAAVSPGIVAEAAQLTAITTALMGATGVMFPNFYRSIGGFLLGGLIALLGVLVIGLFVPAIMEFGIIAWLAAGLFALYIGYDMWRASEIPATLDNAIDVSVALYLDIINLFLWVLRILSND